MHADLGSVNAVLADAVQRRMVGEQVTSDVETADAGPGPDVPVDTDVPRQVRRLREQLDATVAELGITPAGVRRVVDTALELARQRPLRRTSTTDTSTTGCSTSRPLTGSWHRATAGLAEKLETADRVQQRP